jgi:hypothetical protein
MTPEQLHTVASFASALGKLKAKDELGQGCELTRDEVSGIIWGIRTLRAEAKHDAACHPA